MAKARRIRFAGPEHQSREIHALHVHHTSEAIGYYGNGKTVMVVVKPRGRKPIVDVIGEDGVNQWGSQFTYSDYFLPEELA